MVNLVHDAVISSDVLVSMAILEILAPKACILCVDAGGR
jgi:hypothetical protein